MSFIVDISHFRQALAHGNRCRLTASNRASVVLILRPIPSNVELLIIRRAIRNGDPWSGHMGLPGGHRHEQDSSDLQTAQRETREEIGVDLEACAELLGALDDIRAAASGREIELVISPFVYLVGASPSLELNAEVAEVLWAPLTSLSDGGRFICHEVEYDGFSKVLPGWKIGGRIVWGITYRIVSDLLRVIFS